VTKFEAYRDRLFKAIGDELARDPCGKSGEGHISINFPTFWEVRDGTGAVRMGVFCYVLGPGPSRHYNYSGPTLDACVAQAERDLNEWIADAERMWAGAD
jgi:hypothetical protein